MWGLYSSSLAAGNAPGGAAALTFEHLLEWLKDQADLPGARHRARGSRSGRIRPAARSHAGQCARRPVARTASPVLPALEQGWRYGTGLAPIPHLGTRLQAELHPALVHVSGISSRGPR